MWMWKVEDRGMCRSLAEAYVLKWTKLNKLLMILNTIKTAPCLDIFSHTVLNENSNESFRTFQSIFRCCCK